MSLVQSYRVRKDLHVVNGIESLSRYKNFTDFEKRLINGISDKFSQKENDEETIRIRRELDVILRKKHLVDRIKKLYNNTCQLCSIQLEIGKNRYYSEVHHITPLGKPYNGKDILENMICVCPNCHALLDLKVIRLNPKCLNLKHSISVESIEHHNSQIENE
jgi:5-methylcytosine-specific restriction protein A